jgi:hypothetical protein
MMRWCQRKISKFSDVSELLTSIYLLSTCETQKIPTIRRLDDDRPEAAAVRTDSPSGNMESAQNYVRHGFSPSLKLSADCDDVLQTLIHVLQTFDSFCKHLHHDEPAPLAIMPQSSHKITNALNNTPCALLLLFAATRLSSWPSWSHHAS